MKQRRKKDSRSKQTDPREKQERRERAKKRYLSICAIALIWAILIGGFYLFLDRNGRNEPPQTTSPYDVLYSYLSSVDSAAQPNTTESPVTDAPTVVDPSITDNNTPTETSSGQTDIPSVSVTDIIPDITIEDTQPEQEGMNVYSSPNHRFIQIVNKEYGIDTALLTAVYSLPDTGQNYVMEWTGEKDASGKLLRTADTLRRCYLIGTDGKVSAVAAVDPDERVNMSYAENSISINTLIKRVIIPGIADRLG